MENTSHYSTCPNCGNRMKGSALELGARVKCPICGKRLIVANPSDNVAQNEPEEETDEYSLQQDLSPAPNRTVLPDNYFSSPEPPSNSSNIIPNGLPMGSRSHDDLERTQSLEFPATRSAHDDSRHEEEEEEKEDKIDKRYVTPRRHRKLTLIDMGFLDTFNFPFHWKVLPFLLLMTMLAIPLMAVISTMYDLSRLDDTGLNIFTGGYFSGLICVFGVVWSLAVATYGIAILRDTSYDADSVEWPNILMFDSFGDWLAMFAGFFFAALPGWTVVVLSHSSEKEILAVMLISMGIFFPLFLLSILEQNSLFQPFSRAIWRSFFRLPHAWFLFYFLSFGLFGLAGHGLVVSITRGGLWIGAPLAAAVISTAWMIYCRLLGRLTYYCSSKFASEEREEQETEEEDASEDI